MKPKMRSQLKSHLRLLPLALLFLLLQTGAYAQYSSATQYPVVITTEKFQYLSGGTNIPGLNSDDAQVQNLPIGFSFPFCGTSYTVGQASSNGWFSLGTGSMGNLAGIGNDQANLGHFTTYNSFPVIFPFWDDLGWGFGGSVSYLTSGSAPNRVFTMEWKNWLWDFSLAKGSISFQLKLYENGSIQYLYKREDGAMGSQLGITSGWFGGSIGLARSTSDYQFQSSSTMFGNPVTSSIPQWDARPFSDLSIMYLAPCTGAAQGVTIEGPADVCPGQQFRLAAVAQPGKGISNTTWSYSENGANYATISNTAGVITDVITKPRWYKATITCGSASYTTPPRLVDISAHYKCYCNSTASITNNFSGASDIGNVTLVELNKDTLLNNSEAALTLSNNLYSVKEYTDFTQEFKPPVIMYRDSSYIIAAQAINWSTWTDGALSAYIDYNHNSVFDSFERVIFKVVKSAVGVGQTPGQVSDTFTVPDTAKIGITRMRVILKNATTSLPDSCGVYSGGETEDYLIKVDYPPCNGKADAGVIKGDTSMCVGYTYVLTDTTYEKFKGNLIWSWQNSADNVGWYDIPNSTSKDTLQRTFDNQELYYRVRMICARTKDTSYTPLHHISLKPAYKCYCFSQADGGIEHDSSDIGGVKLYNFEITDGGTHLENPDAIRARSDRTDMAPIELMVDSMYSFYVYHTMPRIWHSDAKITIFMDFNNDHKYNIPDERVFTGFTNSVSFTLINNVVVPNAAIVDVPTGMRVILNNDVAPNVPSDEACGTYASGETEDYMLIFRRPFNVHVDELRDINDIMVFPNPTSGRFKLNFRSSLAIKQVVVNVTNMTGQQVLHQVYSHDGGRFLQELDLSSQPKGVYFVELNADGVKATRKLVIQ